jgi:hypothetical protein
MTRPFFAAYLSSACALLRVSGALALTAMATTLAFAVCAAPPAGAQTHGSSARAYKAATHAHRARTNTHDARAHKAACAATHTRRGSHACSPAKGHKHRTKTDAHHKHAIGSRSTPAAQSKAPTPSAPVPSGSPGTTCSNVLNATLDEEGTFACAAGGEPGCQEGFAPVVADDGSTLVCEPEQVEAGGEEEG